MNILYSAVNGQDRSLSGGFQTVLRRQGHQVTFISPPNLGLEVTRGNIPKPGYAHGTALADLLYSVEGPIDLFWYVEQDGFIPLGMEDAPFPSVCILNDMHRGQEERVKLARFFDYVFCQQVNYLGAFREHPPENVIWLPYACDTAFFYPHDVLRDLDIGFIGQTRTVERRDVISELAKKYRMNEQRYYLMDEIPGIYSRARIVVNLPIRDDLNMRFFEAMSCGAMLMTRRDNTGQEKLFQEGQHYEAFGTTQELFEKVEYYLNHEDERAAIALRGCEIVQQKHRMDLRTQTIVDTVQSGAKLAAPIRLMRPAERDRQYAWLFEYFKSTEGGLIAMNYARMAGRAWWPLLIPAGRTFLRHLRYAHFALGRKANPNLRG